MRCRTLWLPAMLYAKVVMRAALESRSYHHEKAQPVTHPVFKPSELRENARKNDTERKGDLIKGVTGEFTASYDELLNARARGGRSPTKLGLDGSRIKIQAAKFSGKSTIMQI